MHKRWGLHLCSLLFLNRGVRQNHFMGALSYSYLNNWFLRQSAQIWLFNNYLWKWTSHSVCVWFKVNWFECEPRTEIWFLHIFNLDIHLTQGKARKYYFGYETIMKSWIGMLFNGKGSRQSHRVYWRIKRAWGGGRGDHIQPGCVLGLSHGKRRWEAGMKDENDFK